MHFNKTINKNKKIEKATSLPWDFEHHVKLDHLKEVKDEGFLKPLKKPKGDNIDISTPIRMIIRDVNTTSIINNNEGSNKLQINQIKVSELKDYSEKVLITKILESNPNIALKPKEINNFKNNK